METKKMSEENKGTPLFKMSKKEIDGGSKGAGLEYYEKDGVKISSWGNDEESKQQYLCQVINDEANYLGLLDNKLQRDNLGLSRFKNGDIYLGYYEKDLRDKHGLYVFTPKTVKGKRYSEYYWGLWKDNLKDTRGSYLWLEEGSKQKPFSDFDSCNFDLFCGEIKFENIVNGVYMVKKDDKYYVYYGGFDDYGNKQGDECYYYNAENDMLLFGKVEMNHFISGYLAIFDEEGAISDLLKVEFGDDHKISSFIEREQIEESIRAPIEKKLTDFRSCILDKDYFGDAFKMYGELISEIDNVSLDTFNSEDDYPHLMNIMTGYNRLGILESIQKVA